MPQKQDDKQDPRKRERVEVEALPPEAVDEDGRPVDDLGDVDLPELSTAGDGPDELVMTDVDPDEDELAAYPLGGVPGMDVITTDVNTEGVMDDIEDYTDDEEIRESFADDQRRNLNSKELLDRLDEHNGRSPDETADDIDASWDDAQHVGDEAVGGLAPTPDQDIVDELGEAVGLTYDDDELLDIDDKLQRRDDHRWELDPESAEDEEDRSR